MNSRQRRVLQSFRGVQGWFVANQQLPASTPALAAQLEALNGVVQRTTEYVARQQTQLAQSLLISKDEIDRRREVLAIHMAPIAKVARALRGIVPGIGVLTMPKTRLQTALLVREATALAHKAEIYKDVLVEQGLPADFIEQLTAAAESLKGSLDARRLARAARTSSTRGVESELVLGRRIVDIIDATMTRVLRNQPAKQTEWRHVKRVTVKGRAARGPVEGVESLVQRIESSPTLVEGSPAPIQGSPTQEKSAA
ncbi:MAG TPA: hypothetical protein VG106_15615 [Vicinamibacterales bacterium]|nr:hypothetical protein [Vicinamibacterales bacterium]